MPNRVVVKKRSNDILSDGVNQAPVVRSPRPAAQAAGSPRDSMRLPSSSGKRRSSDALRSVPLVPPKDPRSYNRKMSDETLNNFDAVRSPRSVTSQVSYASYGASEMVGSVPKIRSEIPDTPEDDSPKGSVLDYFRQFFKTSSARGPMFWCSICICLLILIVVIVALIIYFVYWVGVPSVQILGVDPPKQEDAGKIKVDLGQPGVRAPSFSLQLTVRVRIDNPNKMDLSFEPIGVSAYNPLVPNYKVGDASIDFLTLPKQDSVFLTVPVDIKYDFANDPEKKLPQDLIDSCTIARGKKAPKKQLEVNMGVSPKLKITNEIRIDIPRIDTPFSFDCPFTTDQTINIGGIKVGLNKIDWIALSEGRVAMLP
ncbi:hypothetical protein MP638_002380 [Amoeboaphelidium occidentale]|nr:hypothetical protein MP638_002380 [Amoeboaphelidium occidentale]